MSNQENTLEVPGVPYGYSPTPGVRWIIRNGKEVLQQLWATRMPFEPTQIWYDVPVVQEAIEIECNQCETIGYTVQAEHDAPILCPRCAKSDQEKPEEVAE